MNRYCFLLLTAVLIYFAGCETDQLSHSLVVINGTGSGEYPSGLTVEVKANDPEEGFAFERWAGDTEFLAEVNALTTTVTIPLQDVRIEAIYASLPTYALTVTRGSGSGNYLEGTIVTVSADSALEGEAFEQWMGQTDLLENPDTASTRLRMPSSDVQIEAKYVAIKDTTATTSWTLDILPIFTKKCGICHGPGGTFPDMTDYAEVSLNIQQIQGDINSEFMPPAGSPPLTQAELDMIFQWIKDGTPKN